jgi:hypothetical protein
MEYIREQQDSIKLLKDINYESKMAGVSKEYSALDKAEEELIECLVEVRKLKSHYNEIKVKRKKLDSESRKKVIENLIDEIGDIYVDLFIGISSIFPEITYNKINNRIESKIDKYQKVVDKVSRKTNIKRAYDITLTVTTDEETS